MSDRRLERLTQESGRRQVEEFVLFADHLGVLDRACPISTLIRQACMKW